jgi:SAM-dependent methyltransferase
MSVPQFRSRHFAGKFPFITPRCYVMGKVLTDPLYPAVLEVLRPTREPLLDIGCGMGVLAFYLREGGWQLPCTGVDVDQKKIALAQRLQHQWSGTLDFRAADVTHGLPQHSGSVTLLDMLQYLPHGAQTEILISAAARVSAEGVLVIRNAMSGGGGRAGVTRVTDMLARWGRWMGTKPKDYPDRAQVSHTLAAHGLHGEFTPLWGRTPFHNWLGVFRRTVPS